MSSIREGERAFVQAVFDRYESNDYDAIALGYAPKQWAVKDFSLVEHEGRWHLFHILGQNGLTCVSPDAECRVGHASTADWARWKTHDPLIQALSDWQSHHVFAPFVFAWRGRFHMIYTGINRYMYECLGYATSSDLFAWQRRPDPILDPRGLGWAEADGLLDLAMRGYTPCRDPHVYIEGETLYLYFSAVEKATGLPVIGAAISQDAQHWRDAGIVYRGWDDSWNPACLLESSCVHRLDSGRYLLTFNTRGRVRYVIGDGPLDFAGRTYCDLPTEENNVSLEVVRRRPDRWLVAYFGGKAGFRLSLGALDWRGDEVIGGKRIEARDELRYFGL